VTAGSDPSNPNPSVGRPAFDVPVEAGFAVSLDGADGAVATISLNRPDRRNCQSPHTWNWLVRVRRELPATVRVVVLRGEGGSFSAGLDRAMLTPDGVPGAPNLAALATGPRSEGEAQIAAWQEAFDWTSSPSVVSVAAVQGHAIGAGFQLPLGADIRIVADDVQFCMAEPSLGLVPDLGGTKRLVDLVGYSRAAEICLTARRVGAQEALAIGLASYAVPAADLDSAVARTVAALLAVGRDASAETKALLLAAGARGRSEQEAAEREAQVRRLRSIAGVED
jgi:enoyl-CoA hydratase/carnithine racemase